MSAMASQITSLTIVYSIVYSGADQSVHQSFASLAFVQGIHRWPVNSPHKGPVTGKMFPFEDVIMIQFIIHVFHRRITCGHMNQFPCFVEDVLQFVYVEECLSSFYHIVSVLYFVDIICLGTSGV